MRITSVLRALIALLAGLSFAFAVGAESPQKPASDQANEHYGYPTDWSSRQLVLAGGDADSALAAAQREPRQVYNMVRRMAAVEREKHHHHRRHERHHMKIDWAVPLEYGYVSQSQYPAKYSFQVTADDCNKDYVVFGLTLASGAGVQGNLVGINNLYTGGTLKCHGGTPWVAFSYNTVTQTGGQIRTSPVISGDGTMVAFIESTSAGSYFHVLGLPNPIPTPPSQTGTVRSPATPLLTSSLLCTTPASPGCMTTLQISSASDSIASPWVDYTSDTAYVATDDGKVYKVSPVFRGGSSAPGLVTDSNWPVTVVTSGTSTVLTSPVVDNNVGRIFIADENGYFYAISLSNPAHGVAATQTIGSVGTAGAAIVDPPLIISDPNNVVPDQVFAFTGCTSAVGYAAAVAQLPGNFTGTTTYQAMNLGGNTGNNTCTGNAVHMGTMDNAFWTSGFSTGHLVVCGFGTCGNGSGGCPKIYLFPFDTTTDQITTASASKKIDNNKGEECSPLTEFYDGASDRVFFGSGSSASGEINSFVTTVVPPVFTSVIAPSALGGTSGIVIDNQLGTDGGDNIYFTTLAPGDVNSTNCGTVTGGAQNAYCAVKLTQSGLQ